MSPVRRRDAKKVLSNALGASNTGLTKAVDRGQRERSKTLTNRPLPVASGSSQAVGIAAGGEQTTATLPFAGIAVEPTGNYAGSGYLALVSIRIATNILWNDALLAGYGSGAYTQQHGRLQIDVTIEHDGDSVTKSFQWHPHSGSGDSTSGVLYDQVVIPVSAGSTPDLTATAEAVLDDTASWSGDVIFQTGYHLIITNED